MTTTSQEKSNPQWWKSKKSKWTAIGAVFAAILGLLLWLLVFHPYVSTDDARVAVTLVRIAPEAVSGRVTKIAVQEGDIVKKGDLLVELDHRIVDAQLQRAQAKATLTAQEFRRIPRAGQRTRSCRKRPRHGKGQLRHSASRFEACASRARK